jgi:outer membrane protein insertion porin family
MAARMSSFQRVLTTAFYCVFSLALPIGVSGAAHAQAQSVQEEGVIATAPPAPAVLRQVLVEGNQRVEADTVLSYLLLQPGVAADQQSINLSIQTLFATGLFSDVRIENRGETVVVYVQENPIINRVLLEGNRATDDDTITEEIQAQPRAIFTRARVQADVQRIIEVYRRTGRFAAQVTPRIVELPQNRVDLIFEISEGPVTGVRRVNFMGNDSFSDRQLRSELVTVESHWWRFFSTNDNYDPDRLEYDRELIRQFYQNRGYADFRVVSAVAELTPDQEDFYITFTLDEGDVYNFGEISVESELPDVDPETLVQFLPVRTGALFQGELIESAVDTLNFAVGASGYAFVNIVPNITRDRENRTVDVTFEIEEGPRVYIERIDVVGNTRTLDMVIRRELELVEGDAFNRSLIDRSQARVRRLGFFEDVEITEVQGSSPDRARLQVAVEEQATGELAFGAGFSSTDSFLVDLSISERNLRGRGQFLRFRIAASSRREQIDVRFTEPRFLDRNLAAGIDIFSVRSDFISEASFETQSTGFSLRAGFPTTRSTNLGLQYTLRNDDVVVFAGANQALRNQSGSRITSVLNYSLRWDRVDNPGAPTRGFRAELSQSFAGLGGDVRFVSTEMTASVYRPLFWNFVGSLNMNSGFIMGWGGDEIRINDRFFRGGNSFRGFEVAGVGPRVVARDAGSGQLLGGDALGGRFYAIGTAEMSFPLPLPEQYGVRGSLFTDFGTVGLLDDSDLIAEVTGQSFTVDDLSLRVSAGLSIFWDSPFGPVRFDLAEALVNETYDRTEFFRFSTRTGF